MKLILLAMLAAAPGGPVAVAEGDTRPVARRRYEGGGDG